MGFGLYTAHYRALTHSLGLFSPRDSLTFVCVPDLPVGV